MKTILMRLGKDIESLKTKLTTEGKMKIKHLAGGAILLSIVACYLLLWFLYGQFKQMSTEFTQESQYLEPGFIGLLYMCGVVAGEFYVLGKLVPKLFK